ncbi:MAG: phosphopantetheine-binding protein [Myxococcota bacterium]
MTTLSALTELLRDVLGDDWDDDQDIEMGTSFADDLELESIEFVVLAERIQERFGADVDFVTWISAMDLDAILGLTVGDVVRFIDSRSVASGARA